MRIWEPICSHLWWQWSFSVNWSEAASHMQSDQHSVASSIFPSSDDLCPCYSNNYIAGSSKERLSRFSPVWGYFRSQWVHRFHPHSPPKKEKEISPDCSWEMRWVDPSSCHHQAFQAFRHQTVPWSCTFLSFSILNCQVYLASDSVLENVPADMHWYKNKSINSKCKYLYFCF